MGNRRRINGSGVLRTGYYVWKTTSSNKVLVCRDRLLADGERLYGQTHSSDRDLLMLNAWRCHDKSNKQ